MQLFWEHSVPQLYVLVTNVYVWKPSSTFCVSVVANKGDIKNWGREKHKWRWTWYIERKNRKWSELFVAWSSFPVLFRSWPVRGYLSLFEESLKLSHTLSSRHQWSFLWSVSYTTHSRATIAAHGVLRFNFAIWHHPHTRWNLCRFKSIGCLLISYWIHVHVSVMHCKSIRYPLNFSNYDNYIQCNYIMLGFDY